MTNIGGIVGIVLALCISRPLTDWGIVWLARRNQGVYEPEFRIFLVGAMLFGVFGYAGWAGTIIALQKPSSICSSGLMTRSWYHTQHALDRSSRLHYVRAFSLDGFRTNFMSSSMANFSMVISGPAAVTYLLDTHGDNAPHVLALVNFMKHMVLYGFTFFVNGMVIHRGVKVTLLILAACQSFCWLLSIPMYRYGKRVRAFVSHQQTFCCLFAY